MGEPTNCDFSAPIAAEPPSLHSTPITTLLGSSVLMSKPRSCWHASMFEQLQGPDCALAVLCKGSYGSMCYRRGCRANLGGWLALSFSRFARLSNCVVVQPECCRMPNASSVHSRVGLCAFQGCCITLANQGVGKGSEAYGQQQLEGSLICETTQFLSSFVCFLRLAVRTECSWEPWEITLASSWHLRSC